MSYIPHTKKIALVDCNSFYVSCERLFKPHILKKPVVVLSNNDGCIISRSSEAKVLGIKMGDPYFKAKEIIIKKVNNVFAIYPNSSRRGLGYKFISLINLLSLYARGLVRLSIHKPVDEFQTKFGDGFWVRFVLKK